MVCAHPGIEVSEKAILEEEISRRVQGPTYHLHVERGERVDLGVLRESRLDRDASVMGQHGLCVLEGRVVGLDVHLREAVGILRLTAEGVHEGRLQRRPELGVELAGRPGWPEVVDQITTIAADLYLKVILLDEDPLVPEGVISG